MRISDQLIERFLTGNATEEEERLVAAYLKDHPEKLDQYLTEKNWDAFQPKDEQGVPSEKMRQFLEARIRKPETGKPNARVLPMQRIALVAASVVLLAVTYTWWRQANTPEPAPTIARVKPRQIDTALAITAPGAHTLPDGSEVKLAAKSKITYTENGRDIALTGDAVFTVKKDQTHPFTVHAAGVSTTALGTVFEVDDRKGLKVHLFSGKVVVRKDGAKDMYLKPGQTIILKGKSLQILERKPAEAPLDVKTFNFDNQSLATIFDILKKTYNVPIRYDRATMKNFQFTGAFDRNNETLESILNTLCSLNDLKAVQRAGGGFDIQTP